MRRNLPFTRRQANMLSITRRFKRPVRFTRNHNFAFRRFVSGLPDLSSSTCVSFFNQTWPTGTATTDADLEFMKEEERLQRSFIDQSWPLVPLRWQKPLFMAIYDRIYPPDRLFISNKQIELKWKKQGALDKQKKVGEKHLGKGCLLSL